MMSTMHAKDQVPPESPPGGAKYAGNAPGGAGATVVEIEALPTDGPVLGLDHGTRTIGVAVSDPGRRVATPVGIVRRTRFPADIAKLREFAETRHARSIIVGLPLDLSGRDGPRAQSARAFARNLTKALGLPVALWDERLSTAAVERQMSLAGLNRARRRAHVDAAAAAYILQGALDRIAGCPSSVPS